MNEGIPSETPPFVAKHGRVQAHCVALQQGLTCRPTP